MQRPCLLRLVSIPRLDDRLGLFARGEELDRFLQGIAHDSPEDHESGLGRRLARVDAEDLSRPDLFRAD
jgi:hypothetical protein